MERLSVRQRAVVYLAYWEDMTDQMIGDVENLQRPGWIRAIERTAGRLLPIGSYGLMQVQSDAPISDSESIERAISTNLAERSVPTTPEGYVDSEALRSQIRSYNGNERFVDLVEMVYYELRGPE